MRRRKSHLAAPPWQLNIILLLLGAMEAPDAALLHFFDSDDTKFPMNLFRQKNRHNVANPEQFKKARKKTLFSRSKASSLHKTSGTGNATDNVPKEGTQQNNTNGEASVTKSISGSIPAEGTHSPDGNTSTPEIQGNNTLWGRAYDSLKARNQKLVTEYEEILSKEYSVHGHSEDNSENIVAQNDPQKRQLQMDEFMKKGQQRIEEMETKKSRVSKNDIVAVVNLVLETKEWIGEAVKCSQEASLIWAGVGLVIHLITNPVIAKQVHIEGFKYVTARLGFYNEFETRWLPAVSEGLREIFEQSVKELYENILEFQLLSIIRLYRFSAKHLVGDMFQPHKWKELLSRVKESERILIQDAGQIHQSALYDLQEKTLQFNKELAEREMTREELDCLQLFRLTHTSGSGAELEGKLTYEEFKYRVEYRVEGTCQWFLNQENFKHWLKEDSEILLVTADPGCGKSVLAKYLIDCELPRYVNEAGESAVICYFFFKDQVQSHIGLALCALLHQLFSQKPSLIRHAIEDKKKNGSKLIDIPEKLWGILQNASRDEDAGQVIFVLDALDECDKHSRQKLISFLKSHFQRYPIARGKLKVLLTSRPYGDITYEFDAAFPNMRIPGEDESPKIAEEINAVIQHRVRRLQKKRGLRGDSLGYLERRLMGIKHRTYIWLYLVFDYLENELVKLTEKEMQKKVFDSVPVSFGDAYEKILEKSKDKERALKIFKILLAAYRPLTVGEIQIALETDKTSSSLHDLDLEAVDEFQRSLREYCGLFVSIDDGMVYFLHQTAREFLLPEIESKISNDISGCHTFRHSISIQQAHASLAECCMVYVKFPEWLEKTQRNNRSLLSAPSPDQDTVEQSFLVYASTYWAIHLQQAEHIDDDAIESDAFELCNTKSTTLYPWFHIHWEQMQTGRLERPASALAVSSYFGLKSIVQELICDNELNKDYMNDFDQTSLLWAAERGHEAVVKLLLQTGKMDLNLKDSESGKTPIAYAAENGHEGIARLLLRTGKVDPDSDSKDGWTPLSYAAKNGHKSIAEMLLGTGKVNPESVTRDRFHVTPLAIAAAAGHDEIVKLLFQTAKIDPNPKALDDVTPLLFAASEGHEAVVKLLLEADGIDTEAKGPFGWTSLASEAWSGNQAMVKLLLESGKVDPECRDSHGTTPLHLAAYNGRVGVAKLLLETGRVNPDSTKTSDDQTPLIEAATNGHHDVVKLLLETGRVDPDHKDLYGQTPLMHAAYFGRYAVIKLLLETGKVDPRSKDRNGDTPLSTAMHKGHKAIVELLESYANTASVVSIEE